MFLDPLINRANQSLKRYPEVLDYLINERKFTIEEIDKFRLGYTAIPFLPDSKDPEEKEFLEETKNLYYLKNKILIPCCNAVGLVNGLLTRSMEKETKYRYNHFYLNEAKTSGAFFGLDLALPHILETGVVFVTEGSLDCMTVAKYYPNTVSTLTSFINEDQMYILRMLADTIVLIFDPDEPGRKGVNIVLKKYGNKGIYSRELGHWDPNQCYVRLGATRFEKIIKKELSSFFRFKKVH